MATVQRKHSLASSLASRSLKSSFDQAAGSGSRSNSPTPGDSRTTPRRPASAQPARPSSRAGDSERRGRSPARDKSGSDREPRSSSVGASAVRKQLSKTFSADHGQAKPGTNNVLMITRDKSGVHKVAFGGGGGGGGGGGASSQVESPATAGDSQSSSNKSKLINKFSHQNILPDKLKVRGRSQSMGESPETSPDATQQFVSKAVMLSPTSHENSLGSRRLPEKPRILVRSHSTDSSQLVSENTGSSGTSTEEVSGSSERPRRSSFSCTFSEEDYKDYPEPPAEDEALNQQMEMLFEEYRKVERGLTLLSQQDVPDVPGVTDITDGSRARGGRRDSIGSVSSVSSSVSSYSLCNSRQNNNKSRGGDSRRTSVSSTTSLESSHRSQASGSSKVTRNSSFNTVKRTSSIKSDIGSRSGSHGSSSSLRRCTTPEPVRQAALTPARRPSTPNILSRVDSGLRPAPASHGKTEDRRVRPASARPDLAKSRYPDTPDSSHTRIIRSRTEQTVGSPAARRRRPTTPTMNTGEGAADQSKSSSIRRSASLGPSAMLAKGLGSTSRNRTGSEEDLLDRDVGDRGRSSRKTKADKGDVRPGDNRPHTKQTTSSNHQRSSSVTTFNRKKFPGDTVLVTVATDAIPDSSFQSVSESPSSLHAFRPDDLQFKLKLETLKAKPRTDGKHGPGTKIPMPLNARRHSVDDQAGGPLKRFDSGVEINNISPTESSLQGDDDLYLAWQPTSEAVTMTTQDLACKNASTSFFNDDEYY